LEQVGIIIKIQSYDWGTFYSDIKDGNFQMFSLSWVGIKMPDIFNYVFHSNSVPPQGANRGRFYDAEIDNLIEQAERIVDFDNKECFNMLCRNIYQKLQEKIQKKLPYVPLWYTNHFVITNKKIKNYILANDGNYDSLQKLKYVSE
jgi:peptide/nickel transport system substrate-binding protein